MGFIAALARERGLSEGVVQTVIASWSAATSANYETAWKALRDYMRCTDVSQVPDLTVLLANFLQDRFDSGLSAGYVANMRRRGAH